jgi:hypothetical protein
MAPAVWRNCLGELGSSILVVSVVVREVVVVAALGVAS